LPGVVVSVNNKFLSVVVGSLQVSNELGWDDEIAVSEMPAALILPRPFAGRVAIPGAVQVERKKLIEPERRFAADVDRKDCFHFARQGDAALAARPCANVQKSFEPFEVGLVGNHRDDVASPPKKQLFAALADDLFCLLGDVVYEKHYDFFPSASAILSSALEASS
jgi:hypothetical protein